MQKHQLTPDTQVSRTIRQYAEPFTGAAKDYDALLNAIGNRRFVLIGEASHGTHEYYKTRVDLTRRLIVEKGFNAIALEADWPDSWLVNQYVKGLGSAVNARAA